ncbi:prepilin-type N-terminal cleavage/methylation domain-containing protein [Massilia endophytica]|uniref:prepilin-type N-terminal cleavage/methylation domain-containing protein n=1 Tax=Massilia endophytica TaxID=2899220 RepID=UPI001E459436|nr:prepilin-type N-terminal cleavage/methylation domain-containing protein [Massilia endophytica]UGQ46132.1 prepilin-type N-terminal cleavage/methylation domain-containing protein [Massilia endophytica]
MMAFRTKRGFTLVELLVAITVLAIVAVLGWRGLDGIVRSRVQLTGTMEQMRGMQLAFAQMQSDLEQLAGKKLLKDRANLAADNARLVFVRTTFPENAASQLQVVSYRVRDGVLTRRESPSTRDLAQLDGLWQAAMSDSDPVAGVAMQGQVDTMGVRVWQGGNWQAPGNGGATAPGADTPLGLEMSLKLRGQATPLVKIFLLGAI